MRREHEIAATLCESNTNVITTPKYLMEVLHTLGLDYPQDIEETH